MIVVTSTYIHVPAAVVEVPFGREASVAAEAHRRHGVNDSLDG